MYTQMTHEYTHEHMLVLGEGDRLSAGRRQRDSALGESVAHIQTLLLLCVMNMLLAFLRPFLTFS